MKDARYSRWSDLFILYPLAFSPSAAGGREDGFSGF
jgi:hypothetical protein